MAGLLQVGLSNAAGATALALAAAVAGRWLRGRRPAVVHSLWLLVLLKLLAPPLWTVRLPVPLPSAAPVPRDVGQTAPAANVTFTPDAEPSHPLDISQPIAELAPSVPAPSSPKESIRDQVRIVPLVEFVWASGSLGLLALAVHRTVRFRRLLRLGTPAPRDVTLRARLLAARLGVARPPEVWLVPGAVCPMLWAVAGRARLLLPAGLWGDLPESQRDTLIAHELAHLRRRDHWVRLIEVAATVLYWWHPVVWWARRELREAEEQCCDAWVVWSLPRCVRPYMNAILKAVDFVSDAGGAGRPLPFGRLRAWHMVPPVASGMASGEFRHLERRLSMLRQSETVNGDSAGRAPSRRLLGRGGLIGLCAAAAGLLPLAPSMAEQEYRVVSPKAENTVTEAPESGSETTVTTELVETRSPERAVVVQLTPGTSNAPQPKGVEQDPSSKQGPQDVQSARAEVQRLTAELAAARARLAALEGGANPGTRAEASTWIPTALAPDRPRTASNRYSNGRTAPKGADGQDPQRRMDELERKLDRLLDEVQELKDGRRQETRPATRPPVSLAR